MCHELEFSTEEQEIKHFREFFVDDAMASEIAEDLIEILQKMANDQGEAII